jgi:hypothetical protein
MYPIRNVKLLLSELNVLFKDVKKMVKKIELFHDGDRAFLFVN